jgi:hypothetical protein
MDAATRTATLFVRHHSKDCHCRDKDGFGNLHGLVLALESTCATIRLLRA